jgi:plasmid replication initiation protein
MKDKSLIYKDNRIIEASYRLTLKEQRIVLFCIRQINSNEPLTESKLFTISASEYSSVFGMTKDAAFREIKAAMDQLYERSIKVIDDSGKTDDYRWISRKSVVMPAQTIGFRFATDIAPFLSNLKGRFTKYQFMNVRNMGSVFSIRIYEMLMQWKIKKTMIITIDQLKDRLQVSDKYPAFANVKQKVIDPAIAEINEFSDITANYELLKVGRKVVSVKFTFEFKPGINHKDVANIEGLSAIKGIKAGLK